MEEEAWQLQALQRTQLSGPSNQAEYKQDKSILRLGDEFLSLEMEYTEHGTSLEIEKQNSVQETLRFWQDFQMANTLVKRPCRKLEKTKFTGITHT
jgi:hypothetical protein